MMRSQLTCYVVYHHHRVSVVLYAHRIKHVRGMSTSHCCRGKSHVLSEWAHRCRRHKRDDVRELCAFTGTLPHGHQSNADIIDNLCSSSTSTSVTMSRWDGALWSSSSLVVQCNKYLHNSSIISQSEVTHDNQAYCILHILHCHYMLHLHGVTCSRNMLQIQSGGFVHNSCYSVLDIRVKFCLKK